MDTVDKHHKQNERKPKRGRCTNFETDLSLKKRATGGNSPPVSCTLCSKAHHLDECAEFLKKKPGREKRLHQGERLMFGCYSSEHVAKLCRSRRPARSVIRNTQRRFTITTGNQKRWTQKEGTPNIRNQKRERKTKLSIHVPQSAMWPKLVMFQLLSVSSQYGCITRPIQTTGYVFMLCLIMPVVEHSLKKFRWESLELKELKANFCWPLCMAPRKSILRLSMV